MSKDLKLVLKRKWWDMIASGEKPEEYRNTTIYWRRRLETGWNEPHLRYRRYDTVTFFLGYAKDRPSMTFEFKGVRCGTGNPAWGATPGEQYYVIKLGKRL